MRGAASGGEPSRRPQSIPPDLAVRIGPIFERQSAQHQTRLPRELVAQFIAHDVAEDGRCLGGLKAAIGLNRGPHAAVTEHAAGQFIVAGMLVEDERACGMAKLMRREPESTMFLDDCGDLHAHNAGSLVSTVFAGKQPRGIRSARQHRQVVMHIFRDQSGQRLLQNKLERDPVFYVVVRELQPIGRLRAHSCGTDFPRAGC